MKRRWQSILAGIGIAGLLLAFGIACGGGSEGDTGTLSLSLADTPAESYQAVYVTIKEIHVKQDDSEDEGEWQVVAEPNRTYNLLELTNGVLAHLGLTTLPAGHYNQLRLLIGTTPDEELNIFDEPHPYANYIVDSIDAEHKLNIPSGIQTGIKLVAGFDIYAGQITDLILDFDASRSVVKAGSSGNWLLKPTIKVIGSTVVTVSGTVTDGTDLLEEASITAQVYYPEDAYPGIEPEERVFVQASTLSNIDGNYVLFVQPGTYSLVAYKQRYQPVFVELVAEPSADYTYDFILSEISTGTVSGSVTVDGADSEQVVTLSFRKEIDEKQVELQSINIANGGSYTATLPAGDLIVVASTGGRDSHVYNITVVADDDTALDVNWTE